MQNVKACYDDPRRKTIMKFYYNKEIARQLRIQNATVKNHIHAILAKLHVRRRGEVAARMNGSALLSSGVPSPQHRHLSPHGAIAFLFFFFSEYLDTGFFFLAL